MCVYVEHFLVPLLASDVLARAASGAGYNSARVKAEVGSGAEARSSRYKDHS